MRMIKRLRPSPATVIASIALLVALSGTSYAAFALAPRSVGNLQLKTGAVNSRVLTDHGVRAVDLAPGVARSGPAGPAGPAGAAGAAGPTGPAGAAGATNLTVHVADTTVPAGDRAANVVACPSGQKATGGGGYLDGSVQNEDHFIQDGPVKPLGGSSFSLVSDGDTPTGWRVSAYNAGASARTLHVYVICAAS